jgi:DNA polymerase (family 10)
VNISELDRPAESLTSEEIKAVPGIGNAIFEKISEALKTGTFPTLEKWRASGYASFLSLLETPGMTARKVGAAIKRLKIESMDDIKELIDSGKTELLKSIDEKIREAILNHISRG